MELVALFDKINNLIKSLEETDAFVRCSNSFIREKSIDEYTVLQLIAKYAEIRPKQRKLLSLNLHGFINTLNSSIQEKLLDYIHENKDLNKLYQKDNEYNNIYEPNSILFYVKEDDLNNFEHLFKENPQILNTTFDKDVSLIDIVCLYGSLDIFNYLIVQKPNITQKTLQNAVRGGRIEIIKHLRNEGHSFKDYLEVSIEYNQNHVTEFLINNYNYEEKDFEFLKSFRRTDQRYLKSFSFSYYGGILSLLERNKLPLNLILILTSYDGLTDIVKYLIEEKGADVNAKFEDNRTPLHYASYTGHIDLVKYLIDKGADVNAKAEYNATPLHFASEKGHIDIVKYLIDKGVDVNAKDEDNKTPLHMASLCGHIDLVKYLIDKGADVNAKDIFNEQPLHFACLNGHIDIIDIVKYLIDKGADVNAKAKYNETPLHDASLSGHIDLVKYLIDKGADVNAKDEHNQTPLHRATDKGHTDIVKYLIDKGADINA